jgi:hypothetical protein
VSSGLRWGSCLADTPPNAESVIRFRVDQKNVSIGASPDVAEVCVSWWWCLNHSRAEQDPDVDAGAADRLGPYETEEAAKNWRQQFAERNERWDKWDQEDKEGRKK